MTGALSIEHVTHRYGAAEALSDVSLTVAAGSFSVLLGVNGAGKTTLFNLITRLFATQSGTIRIGGQDLARAPSRALAGIGVVFQSRALDASLTVAQNIVYQGALHGIGRREALDRGRALLALVGLQDRMDAKASQLSGGQQRRVEIARALLHRPKLLLCDEATAGLDVKARTDIVADMHRMAAEDGLGILWTTHLIDEVAPDDPVTVLHQGCVLAQGGAADIAGGRPLADAFLALTGAAAAQ
ncbi:MAG: ATP-binding cassette domain-containing protein [Pseudomonadota bacterium]